MEKENFQCILCRVCLHPQSLSIAPCLIIFALIWASTFMGFFVYFFFSLPHTDYTQVTAGEEHTETFALLPWVVLSWSSFTGVLYPPHLPCRISALVSLISIMQCALIPQWKSSRFFSPEEPCLQLLHTGKLLCVQTAPSKISNTIHDNHRITEELGWKES